MRERPPLRARLAAILALAPLAESCGTTGHKVSFEAGPASFEFADEEAWTRGLAAVVEVAEKPDGSVLARLLVELAANEPEAIRIEETELIGWALDVPETSITAGFAGEQPDGVLRPQEFSLSRIEEPVVSPTGEASFELQFTYPEDASVNLPDLDGVELYLFITDGTHEGGVVVRFSRRSSA